MINVSIKDIELVFNTSPEVFSPRTVDEGTMTMLSFVEFQQDDKVLDLGCGYGVVGILAAKFCRPSNVVLIDIHDKAIELSRYNAELNDVRDTRIIQSDGLKEVPGS